MSGAAAVATAGIMCWLQRHNQRVCDAHNVHMTVQAGTLLPDWCWCQHGSSLCCCGLMTLGAGLGVLLCCSKDYPQWLVKQEFSSNMTLRSTSAAGGSPYHSKVLR